MMPGPPNRRVVAVAYDGLCLFEFGIAAELFGLARPELDVPWYEFRTVSVDPGPVRALGGVTIAASHDLRHIRRAGTVVFPGWKGADVEPSAEVLRAVRAAHSNGARLVSICSGVFALAATGLLDGLAATTHWRYAERLASKHPAIDVQPNVLFVDNGRILTSAGSAAGLDLGLHLVTRDFGASVAAQVARRLVLPLQRDGGQAQFVPPRRTGGDASRGDNSELGDGRLVREAIDWALAHLDRPITVADLARVAAMSERTFARKFASVAGQPPGAWLVGERVRLARALLETTDLPLARVANACGFGSVETMRHHLRRLLATTPSRYRASFAAPQLAAAATAGSRD